MGVIGTGKIGKIFIDICRGFRMNVIAYDLYPDNASDINYVELNELFAKSDIISLHCPLTNETDHIINAESIAKMKKGVVIINTSRGGLIETEALIDAIKAKVISAACLDVYEEESDIFFEDNSGHIMQDDNLARLRRLRRRIYQTFLRGKNLKTKSAITAIKSLSVKRKGRDAVSNARFSNKNEI